MPKAVTRASRAQPGRRSKSIGVERAMRMSEDYEETFEEFERATSTAPYTPPRSGRGQRKPSITPRSSVTRAGSTNAALVPVKPLTHEILLELAKTMNVSESGARGYVMTNIDHSPLLAPHIGVLQQTDLGEAVNLEALQALYPEDGKGIFGSDMTGTGDITDKAFVRVFEVLKEILRKDLPLVDTYDPAVVLGATINLYLNYRTSHYFSNKEHLDPSRPLYHTWYNMEQRNGGLPAAQAQANGSGAPQEDQAGSRFNFINRMFN